MILDVKRLGYGRGGTNLRVFFKKTQSIYGRGMIGYCREMVGPVGSGRGDQIRGGFIKKLQSKDGRKW